MGGEEWQMADGKWQMADAKWSDGGGDVAVPTPCSRFKLLRVVFLDFDAVEPVRPVGAGRRAAIDEVEDFAGAGGNGAGGGPGRVVEVVLVLQQVAEAGLGLDGEGRRAVDDARV